MPASRRTLLDRLETRVAGWQVRVRGRHPGLLALRVGHRFVEVRVPGLAAEMSHYLVLSLVPLVTALGASMGLLGRVLNPAQVAEMEDTLAAAVEAVLSPELARDVAVPLVQELLRQERVGVALGSVVGALWLGSRVFRAAVRALDDAYLVGERRGPVQLFGLSLVFTVTAVVVITLLLGTVVVGPLLGGGARLAEAVGAGQAFAWAWSLGRWPVVMLAGVVFLAWLYHVGPNTDTRWRDALPGALLAIVTLVVLAAGFRLYVDVAGPRGPQVQDGSDAVRAVGQFIGTALAAILFTWLASAAVLLGGVFNAEWNPRPAADAADPGALAVDAAPATGDAAGSGAAAVPRFAASRGRGSEGSQGPRRLLVAGMAGALAGAIAAGALRKRTSGQDLHRRRA